MERFPLLLLSDAPTSGTGLGRITRDLAVRIHANIPEIEVATLGYAGPQKRALEFPQYNMEMQDWVVNNLQEVWEDFVGKRRGAVMSIWDASRMMWFSRPETLTGPHLRKWLLNAPFEKWGYFPMDATGPNDRLTALLGHTVDGYDRVLAYSKWAEGILQRTLAPKDLDLDWRPHGIDTEVFFPRDHRVARHRFGERTLAKTLKGKFLSIPDDAIFVGVVATNQTRKDFGLALQVIQELKRRQPRPVIIWVHTDELNRHWSLPSLFEDYGIEHDQGVITGPRIIFPDELMTWCYSACDVTLGIGMSEGYGYPIFESLACGTPCIHGRDHGGAYEHMPEYMTVPSRTTRLEGIYNCVRPVHRYEDWVEAILALPKRTGESLLPTHLDWNNLWPSWAEWLKKGLPNVG
jgi:glycosyltransferase involved in cell wall biosynthesis